MTSCEVIVSNACVSHEKRLTQTVAVATSENSAASVHFNLYRQLTTDARKQRCKSTYAGLAQ